MSAPDPTHYATGVFKRYRIVRRIRHAPWRYGLLHLVPGVRLKYRGRWHFNGATR